MSNPQIHFIVVIVVLHEIDRTANAVGSGDISPVHSRPSRPSRW
jgi:hypothetical protein